MQYDKRSEKIQAQINYYRYVVEHGDNKIEEHQKEIDKRQALIDRIKQDQADAPQKIEELQAKYKEAVESERAQKHQGKINKARSIKQQLDKLKSMYDQTDPEELTEEDMELLNQLRRQS